MISVPCFWYFVYRNQKWEENTVTPKTALIVQELFKRLAEIFNTAAQWSCLVRLDWRGNRVDLTGLR